MATRGKTSRSASDPSAHSWAGVSSPRSSSSLGKEASARVSRTRGGRSSRKLDALGGSCSITGFLQLQQSRPPRIHQFVQSEAGNGADREYPEGVWRFDWRRNVLA